MEGKTRNLVIFMGVLLATVMMAASLSSLELRSGGLFTFERDPPEPGTDPQPGISYFMLFIRFCILIGLAFIPLSFIFLLTSREWRRQIFTLVIIYLFFVLVSGLILKNLKLGGRPIPRGELPLPDPPEWLVLVFSFLLSMMILRASMMLWRRLHRKSEPLQLVADEAREALKEIGEGADLRDVVMRCYFEMSQVLRRERGIERMKTSTTREFEDDLIKAGIPDVHVRRLTRLFEMARYGSKNLGERENREAVSSLKAIVRACESAEKR
jgi:hypothetical protein